MIGKMLTIKSYFDSFPEQAREKLEIMRQTIKKAAPQAEELISYNMPAFKLNGILVYYAAYKNHIGFYPTASGIANFQKEFSGYKYSKGAVQFPINEPLPLELITKIVKFRVNENLIKLKEKTIKK